MEKIVKILCVCAVLLVGGLGAKVAEAKAAAVEKIAGPAVDILWEVGDWLGVGNRSATGRDRNDRLVFPGDEHFYFAASADEQERTSFCTTPFQAVELRAFASVNLPRRGSHDTLLESLFPLLQTHAMARQSTGTLFRAHLTDDLNASETKRAFALKGSWLTYGEVTSYRMQDNNKCLYYGALKDSLARTKNIAFPIGNTNQHNSPSTILLAANRLLIRDAIDCSPQTTSQFQGEQETMLPRKISPLNESTLLCLEVASRFNAHDIDIDDMRVAELAERIG